LHILYVAQSYFPYLDRGGLPTKVRFLSRRLSARGHSVTVLTANLGKDEWERRGFRPEPSPFGLRFHEDGVAAIYLPTWLRFRHLTVNPGVTGFCRFALQEFDLAHFFGLYDLLGPIVSSFCRHKDIPYVIEPMGMFRPIDRSLRTKRIWHRTVGKAHWRNASLIVATSELEQQELLKDGELGRKLALRYNGIEEDISHGLPIRGEFRKKYGIAPGVPLIFFLSRIIPRKGADILIQAFAEACPPQSRLVIAGPEGEAGYLDYLQNCVLKVGVESRVIFPGALYGREKLSVYSDADLFVLPSRYENFANVVAEAIACNVPVIITRQCGISSLVESRAGLVIEREKPALVRALRLMLEDADLYTRMKAGCRELAEKLTWDEMAAQMEAHYKSILSHGRVAP
jgi:glycosyltransferase involved in cell wall biosynthesis